MSDLSDQGRDYALQNYAARLLPVDVETWADISASVAFGPFTPGDYVVIVNDAPAHVNAGAAGGAAIATNPQLPAGERDYVVPDVTGETSVYVHLFGDGAGNGCVFKAS